MDHLGCFIDRPERDLDGKFDDLSTNSIENCIEWCGKLGYAYAGQQFG